MKKVLIAVVCIIITGAPFCRAQAPILCGMTSVGGASDGGVFFKITSTGKDTSLHSFGSGNDGNTPTGSLIQANNGLLYGMTEYGGAANNGNGGGVIFSYNITTGADSVVYSFGSGTDGSNPDGSLMQASNGLLYGLTRHGGINNQGIIFSFNTNTGAETDLYDFGDTTDGAEPHGSLIEADSGWLYGLTELGGADSLGTIFSYNIKTGQETNLHSFDSIADGAYPAGSLVRVNDSLLFGMTMSGGIIGDRGTIFSYNIKSGKETDLHDFGSIAASDGVQPFGSLTYTNDSLLYGMTNEGGDNSLFGTIFKFNIFNGNETVLHSFGNGNNGLDSGMDGENPYGSLLWAKNGILYGTTSSGGRNGFGTVFSYNIATATETNIHSFADSDGNAPYAGLLEVDSLVAIAISGISPVSAVNNQLTIFPNPSTGQFTVQLQNYQLGCLIEVYNVEGENIYQSPISNSGSVINLSSQPDGMYFVLMKSNREIQVQKVLIAGE